MFYFIPLLVLSGTSSITANLELQCQQGWHKNDDNCYWFSDFNTTRDNAKLQCESRESKLVTIDSNATNSFLKQHITGDMSYWIGLRMDNIAISAWRWNTGGPLNSRITTLNWCDNRTDPNTACALMEYGGEPCLKSYTCSKNLPFICEKVKPEGVTSCLENWNFYSDGTPRCFYMSGKVKMTRMEAAKYCVNIGGRLVTVPSYLNKVYLINNRPTTDNIHWLGLSPYKWDDGTHYNWNNWDDGGPSIGHQCTRLLSDAKWKYGECSTEEHNFICQKDAIPFIPTTRSSTTTTTTQTSQSSTVSSTATTQANIEDRTTSASTSGPTTSTYSISATTSKPTRTVSTSSITQMAGISTTYTLKTMTITQNVNTMSSHAAPDSTTVNDTENAALGNSETSTTLYNGNDRSIILYVLIGIYTAVGVTAIVFMGLLAKYISLRRRYERLNGEKPNETEIDFNDLDEDNGHTLYENPQYVGVEQHESIASVKVTDPRSVETDNIVYSEIDVDSRKPKDSNDIETKQTSGDTDIHQVNQVPVRQNNHSLSNKEHDVVKPDDEHSEQAENIHLYYNDPECMTSLTNSEQVNIYDDPINVAISESDDRDI